jgi:hypothetical protein
MLERLHSEVAGRLRAAYAPKSQGSLQSAIAALARFSAACPDRELFRRPRFHGDLEMSAYNEWTLMLFAWFLVSEPSPATGRPVKVETVRTYVSLLKGYLEFSYAFSLVLDPRRLKRFLDAIASDEPMGGVRKKRRGFRRRHLRRLWRSVPWARATDADTVNKLAAVGAAWHVLARGGEICPSVPHSRWQAGREPTRADLCFGRQAGGKRYAVLWLRPLKKKGRVLQPKVPQYIAEHDGGGSDVYMLLRRLEELDPVPDEERESTPLFRQSTRLQGARVRRHMTVSQLRSAVRAFARALGYDVPAQWGAHSPRIGGATDLSCVGKVTELMLRAKGRWASDIGAIYSRLTRRALLGASRLMQKARGRDIEEIMPTFVQPA